MRKYYFNDTEGEWIEFDFIFISLISSIICSNGVLLGLLFVHFFGLIFCLVYREFQQKFTHA